jgi:hypothetical protein
MPEIARNMPEISRDMPGIAPGTAKYTVKIHGIRRNFIPPVTPNPAPFPGNTAGRRPKKPAAARAGPTASAVKNLCLFCLTTRNSSTTMVSWRASSPCRPAEGLPV